MTPTEQPRNLSSTQQRQRLILIGFRGCGKTTVGRALSELLGWPFIDADHVLEERLGCSVATCFARDGEAAFRSEESACLRLILAKPSPWVLATGGGVVLREDNRSQLIGAGALIVYLEAEVATLQARLGAQAHRPSLTGGSVVDEVPVLLAQRRGHYQALAQVVLPAADERLANAQRLVAMIRPRR